MVNDKKRIAELELALKELEEHRLNTRKIFYNAMDASAMSWFKEVKRRHKAERQVNFLTFQLKALLNKPKRIDKPKKRMK